MLKSVATKINEDPLIQAEMLLTHVMQTKAMSFLPSQWTLACQESETKTPPNSPFSVYAQIVLQCYLHNTRLAYQNFENILATEIKHLPEDAICITAQGDFCLPSQLSLRAKKAFPLRVAFIIHDPAPTSAQTIHNGQPDTQNPAAHESKSIMDFWKSLRKSAWLRESLQGAFKQMRPVVYASILINLLALAAPFFSIQVYDRIIPNAAYASLVALLLGVALCLGFEHILKNARHSLMEHVATSADTLCSKKLSDALLSVRTNKTEPAILLQHLRSFEQLREIITGMFLLTLIDMPFLGIFLLVIGIIHPFFLLIAGAAIALTLLVVLASHRAMASQSRKHMVAFREGQNQWLDALANLEQIQAQGVQSPFANMLNKTQLKARLENNVVRTLLFHANQHVHLLQQGSWVLTVALGVLLVVKQELTVGGLIAVSMLTMRCFGPIQRLQSHLMQTHSAQASFEDLDKFLSKPNSHASQGMQLAELQNIELESVSVLKPNAARKVQPLPSDHLLRNLGLTIQSGERIGVIGPMGSGKTSLLRLLAQQLDMQSGAFKINGLDHSHYPITEYARHLGVALQPPILLKGTLLENLQYKRPWVSVQDCLKALEQVGMRHWVNHHPDGLHMHIEALGANLSTGQKQAVCIARALAGQPRLLLLDEPTISLDQQAENALVQTLQQLPESTTVILTTHKLNLLTCCKRLVLVNEGEIVAQGDKADVLEAASELMAKRQRQEQNQAAS